MFKSLLVSLVILGSITAHAQNSAPETLTIIGWGIDGATARPMPATNSGDMAAEVYAALGGRDSTVQLGDDENALEANDSSVTLYIADQKADIKFEKNKNGNANVRLEGRPAQFLFENLNVASITTVGAINKKAGNVVCSSGFNQGGNFYKCLLTDVNAVQIPAK